jgi:hypothetical protein
MQAAAQRRMLCRAQSKAIKNASKVFFSSKYGICHSTAMLLPAAAFYAAMPLALRFCSAVAFLSAAAAAFYFAKKKKNVKGAGVYVCMVAALKHEAKVLFGKWRLLCNG